MASFLPPAIFEIKAVADQAIAKFKEVEGELDKMGKQADGAGGKISKMDKASKLATGALIGMGTAFAGFAAIGIKGVIEDEKAFTKLGQTFSNLGINIEANRNLVGELDVAYSKLGFGGDETATALNKLVSTTNDLEKSQGLLSISADLARVKNIDLASAASVVAKASMGNAKAFKEMGIELDTTLPKSEAIAKAMDQLNDKVGGQAIAYTKTFAGQLVVLREQISAVADTVGGALLPYLKQMVDVVANSIEFIKKNSAVFKILAGVIITITVALAAYNAAVKVQMALTKAWTVITGVQAAVTKLLTGQQVALNTAMKLNPIGLIVSAVVLLIGAMLLLWNKSENFRKIMIEIGKVGVKAFGFLIGVIGDLATGFIKIATGPLKLLLKGLALLGNDNAKNALKGLESATEGVGKFFDSAAKKVTNMAGSLDKLNKPIKLTFSAPPGVPELPNVTGGTGAKGGAGAKGGVSKETAKANEGYMKIVKDLNEKVTAARTKFNETMFELEKDYNKTTTKLRENAAERIASLTKNHNEKVAKLEADAKKKTVEATNKFNETMADLNAKKAQDLEKAAQDNINKIAEITAQGNEKLLSIVESSVNRLRDAFKKGTAFSVTDLFKGLSEAGTASVTDLLTKMKEKLAASKELAKNAALLQAKGFSQTFIEEVVAAGPEVGNKLAQSIMDANPDTIKELQATYADIEATTDTGLDALAKAMNAGGKLATAELNKAYAEAQTDLQQSLAKQAKEYTAQQAEINKTFNQAMADAEKTRDAAIASAMSDLAEALAEENKMFNEAVAEVNSELATALAEAQADFVEKTEAARKQLNDTLTEIEKDFKEKLGKITDATKKTSAEITAMLANFNNAKAIMMTPIVIPAPVYAASGGGGGGTTSKTGTTTGKTGTTATTNITTNVTANTNASPAAIATAVTNATKFGTTGGYTYTNTSVGARDR
jgi:DNA-directed RNA polymerase subunit F